MHRAADRRAVFGSGLREQWLPARIERLTLLPVEEEWRDECSAGFELREAAAQSFPRRVDGRQQLQDARRSDDRAVAAWQIERLHVLLVKRWCEAQFPGLGAADC